MMKKLLLLVGLVVFLTPSLVNAKKTKVYCFNVENGHVHWQFPQQESCIFSHKNGKFKGQIVSELDYKILFSKNSSAVT